MGSTDEFPLTKAHTTIVSLAVQPVSKIPTLLPNVTLFLEKNKSLGVNLTLDTFGSRRAGNSLSQGYPSIRYFQIPES